MIENQKKKKKHRAKKNNVFVCEITLHAPQTKMRNALHEDNIGKCWHYILSINGYDIFALLLDFL